MWSCGKMKNLLELILTNLWYDGIKDVPEDTI